MCFLQRNDWLVLITFVLLPLCINTATVAAAENQWTQSSIAVDKKQEQDTPVTEKKLINVTEVSSQPILCWPSYTDAVMYEFQIAQSEKFAADSILFQTTDVFTFGYQPDLSPWLGQTVYYRYRPLDYERQAIAPWSPAVAMKATHPEKFSELQPCTTANWSKVTPILYPVYSWIPVSGAGKYKVEIYSVDAKMAGEKGNGYQFLRSYDIEGGLTFDCYDEEPRVGQYAWRVQALDKSGLPIGRFSDMEEFSLEAVPHQFRVGVFGDSIMHGGGAISGSPADARYSLHAYLNPPAVNLARSGDTSAASLQRFDQDVTPFSPQILIVMTGTNSLRGGEKADEVMENLSDIYNKCKDNNIAAIFLTLPPINPERIATVFQETTASQWQNEFQKVNQFIRQNLPHVDVASLFTDASGMMPVKWSTDGLHPDGKAKKAMADAINRLNLREFSGK
ncbi:MAG TPA: SGNH/GDSL hydrolase family protein [Patescibacteria group bacterium]|nr:SGNH/GDSL hydrolase family protein [Patescibacteria group bacterium]